MTDDPLESYARRWRESQPSIDLDPNWLSTTNRRRWVAPSAAAAAVALLLGGTWAVLGSTDTSGGPQLGGTGTTGVVPDPGAVVPWALLDPRFPEWHDEDDLRPLEARQVSFDPGGPGQPPEFVLELVAPSRDLVLDPCPDAMFISEHSLDDETDQPYAMNCQDVPYRDSQGRPYLPQGVPVRFSLQPFMSQGSTVTYRWRLELPRPVEIPLTVPGTVPALGLVRTVPQEQANLLIDVTNQSFLEPDARIQVWVDNELVADRDFEVGSQHSWITFPVHVEPGPHAVRARMADADVDLARWVTVPAGAPTYAQISWWHESGGAAPEFGWRVQDEPIGYD